jgi:hypothetical protein
MIVAREWSRYIDCGVREALDSRTHAKQPNSSTSMLILNTSPYLPLLIIADDPDSSCMDLPRVPQLIKVPVLEFALLKLIPDPTVR